MEKVTTKKHKSMKKAEKVSNTIIYIILSIMMIVWLIPFVFLVFESFRCESTYQVGYVIPKQWGFDNYINLFTKTDFLRWYTNTFIIALVSCIIQTIMQLTMAYTLSRLRFKGRKLLMNIMLILGMFPGFISIIILYKVFSWAGLTQSNAPLGLIISYTASSAMGYYVIKGYFDTIPRSLDEAARIDGATRFQVFYKVIMPLAKPIVIYTLLTAFMAPWGDFMFANYIAHAASKGMNVAVGLQNMISKPDSLAARYTMFCAGGVLVAIPVTILFMCLQRYYVEGVTGGAVKG